MSETRFWTCDGCGYETGQPPGVGVFYRYSEPVDTHGAPLVAMTAVAFHNPMGDHDKVMHVCESCFVMGIVSAERHT